MADDRYAYAVARVKVLETRLIDRATVDRLMGETPQGLFEWARESEYAEAFADVASPLEFPVGLHRHISAVFDLLEKIIPKPEVIHAFRLRYDYHNLRALFKANVLGREAAPALSDLGTIPPDRLANLLRDEMWLWIPDRMRDAWRTAHATLDRGGSLRLANAGFDNARWQHRLALAEQCKEPFLDKMFREAITMHNIITFIRVKDGAANREDIDDLLLDGSVLGRSFFRRHYDEPVQLFLDSLAHTDYARHIMTRATAALSEERAYWRLDVARDNYFVFSVQAHAHDPFGVGPIVHYLVRKKAEGKLLYSLWLAAKAGWHRATMQDRLRSAYV